MKTMGSTIAIGILIAIVCLAVFGWLALAKEAPEGEAST